MRAHIDEILENAHLDPWRLHLHDELRQAGYGRRDAREIAQDNEISYATVFSWLPEVKGSVPIEVKVRNYAQDHGLLHDSVFDSSSDEHEAAMRVGFLTYFTGGRLGRKHNELRLTCTSYRCQEITDIVEDAGFSYEISARGKSRTTIVEPNKENCCGYFMKGLIPELQNTRERLMQPPGMEEHDYQPFLQALFAAKGKVNGGINVNLISCESDEQRRVCEESYKPIFQYCGIEPVFNGHSKVGIYVPADQIPSWYNRLT